MGRHQGQSLGLSVPLVVALAGIIGIPALAFGAPSSRGLTDAPVSEDALEEAFQSRRIAVVVGVDEYDNDAFPELRFATKDAEAFGELLADPMWSGFDDVVVLTLPEETTRVAILSVLDDFKLSLHRNDTFLFYFSGHGTLVTDDSGDASLYLCPRDADPAQPRHTGLAVNTLQRIFKSFPCRRKVLVLDSCHNGQAKSFVADEDRERLSRQRSALDPRVSTRVGEAEAHLFAAAFHQPALEDPDLGHGVYTYYLLESLGERSLDADLDGDGVVSVVEAHEYARDNTIRHTGGRQVPQAIFKEVGREDIFLSGTSEALLAAEHGLLTSYSKLLADCRISVDGTPRGILPRALPVEPGMHRVEVVEPQSGRVLVQRMVQITAGHTLSVDVLADERRPERNWSLAGGMSGFGMVGPFGRSYPTYSAGPDISLRRRLNGATRDVRLSFDVAWAHGSGNYAEANDILVQADMFRGGISLQAIHDTDRLNGWFGSRLHVIGVWVRESEQVGEQGYAVMPAAGLLAGVDIWGRGNVGMQIGGFADFYPPIVEDTGGDKYTRLGILLGGQVRILGVIP